MKFLFAIFCLIAMLGLSTVSCTSVFTPCQKLCNNQLAANCRTCGNSPITADWIACRKPYMEIFEKCKENCFAQEGIKWGSVRPQWFHNNSIIKINSYNRDSLDYEKSLWFIIWTMKLVSKSLYFHTNDINDWIFFPHISFQK